MTTNATKNIRCFSVVFYLKMFNMRCAVFIGSSAIRQDRSSIDQWLFIVIVFECCKQFCEIYVCVCVLLSIRQIGVDTRVMVHMAV